FVDRIGNVEDDVRGLVENADVDVGELVDVVGREVRRLAREDDGPAGGGDRSEVRGAVPRRAVDGRGNQRHRVRLKIGEEDVLVRVRVARGQVVGEAGEGDEPAVAADRRVLGEGIRFGAVGGLADARDRSRGAIVEEDIGYAVGVAVDEVVRGAHEDDLR